VPEFREAPAAAAEPAEEDLYAMGVIKGPSAPAEEQTAQEASTTPKALNLPKDIEEEEYPSYGYVPGQEGMTPPAQGITPPLQQMPQGGYQQMQMPQGGYQQMPQQGGYQQMPQQGGYQQMVPAPLMYQQPYVMQQPMIYQPPMAQGPPTIVIDTSPMAMQQGGFLDELQEARSGVPVMGRRSMDRRHTTPRANARAASPQARPKGISFGGEPLSTGQRITIQKMG